MKRTLVIRTHSGFSMIEILIALFVTLIGLLGIGALQAKAQQAEFESYQRAQALVILSDIVDRVNINRSTIACFAITTNTTTGLPFLGATGTGHLGTPTCAASTTTYNTQAVATLNAIDSLLLGSAERLSGANVGAMIGARACLSYDASTELSAVAGTGYFTVVISWQALSDLPVPLNKNCANTLYGDLTKRRAISTRFRVANLFG
ncbi:MAG: type IV pilus assembly protein PilV [Planctomycetota bacterium]|jgi:type IV pilus assembly protein PilV